MTVKRIVMDVATDSIAEVRSFYENLFGLETVMDHGWIVTLSGEGHMPLQISIMTEGGSGAPTPDASIEVDDVDAVYEKANDLGYCIKYPLTNEPWNVRRFFVLDPAGKLLNALSHTG